MCRPVSLFISIVVGIVTTENPDELLSMRSHHHFDAQNEQLFFVGFLGDRKVAGRFIFAFVRYFSRTSTNRNIFSRASHDDDSQ